MLKKIIIFIVLLVLVAIGFFFFKGFQFYKKIYSPISNNKKTVAEKTTFNILLLGYGGAGHDGAYLTDTTMVAHIDTKKKEATLISIPRDVYVKLPTKSGKDFHSKINAVYEMDLFPKEYPDVKTDYAKTKELTAVKSAISQVTGLNFDNYVAIDFSGFKKAVDILGGVDVNVEKTFDDYEYPVDGKETDTCGKVDKELTDALAQATQEATLAFPCRYEHLHFTAGLTHMDGDTALKYARSRHSLQDGTDFGRARRQQLFIEAVKEKVLNIGFIPKVIPLMDELQQHILTDVSPADLQKLLGLASQAKEYKITSLVISNTNYLKDGVSQYGEYILQPKAGVDIWDDVQAWVKNSIAGITPTPTASASATLSTTPGSKFIIQQKSK